MGFKFYISMGYCLWYSQVSNCVCIENCVSDFTLEGKSVNLITEAPVLSAFFTEVIIEGRGRKKRTYQPSRLWFKPLGHCLSSFSVRRIIWESVHVDFDSVSLGSWFKPPGNTDVTNAWTVFWVARLYISHDKDLGLSFITPFLILILPEPLIVWSLAMKESATL